MRPSDVYCFSTLDHRIPDAEIDLLGPSVPEFYWYLAGTLGCGSISHFFDICRPQQLREHTAYILAQADAFEWSFQDTLEAAYVVAHGLLGNYWYAPVSNELFILEDFAELSRIDSSVDSVFRHIEAGASGERLVFHPFERRQRLRFSHSSHESAASPPGLFDETVRWFKEAGLHDHSEMQGSLSEVNRSATLYFPAFGGDLYICQGGGGVSLTLGFDRGISSSRLERLLSHAETAGWRSSPHPHDE